MRRSIPGIRRAGWKFFLRNRLRPVVTQSVFADSVSIEGARVVCVDDPEERKRVEGQEGSNLVDDPAPEAPACILYTSGSTGTPRAWCRRIGDCGISG